MKTEIFSSSIIGLNMDKIPENDFFQDIFTLVMLFVVVLMAAFFTIYRKEIKQLGRGLFASRISAQVIRDGSILRSRIVLFLYPCVILVQASFLFYLAYMYIIPDSLHLSTLLLFLIALGAFVLDIFFKYLAFNFFAYLFDYDKNDKMEYMLQKIFYLTDISLILFPLLICTVYMGVRQILWLYSLFFLIIYVTMFVRLFMLNRKKGNSFHFFLYFCTVEILPYIIVLKTALLLGK